MHLENGICINKTSNRFRHVTCNGIHKCMQAIVRYFVCMIEYVLCTPQMPNMHAIETRMHVARVYRTAHRMSVKVKYTARKEEKEESKREPKSEISFGYSSECVRGVHSRFEFSFA